MLRQRSVADRVFAVWRSPGRFTKNPDIIALPSGRLLLVYNDTITHLCQGSTILTLLASDDGGRTWFKQREVTNRVVGVQPRIVTPRLSRLSDGRLVIAVDEFDVLTALHEDGRECIILFWSDDNGGTWSEAQPTGIRGIENDRVIELPDGRLALGTHYLRGDSLEFAENLWCSDDRGKTWYHAAEIAHDGYHRFCEGALVILEGGTELACIMRENHSAGIPCLIAFSRDNGRNWSAPQYLPFSLHRPYAKQLTDGRVLVTGRNVNGGLGTYAWCGDLRAEAGRWVAGGPRRTHVASLTPEALVIENGPEHECRYTLLPPQSNKSDVLLEAVVRVEGPIDQPVAALVLSKVYVSEGWGAAGLMLYANGLAWPSDLPTGRRIPVDMSDYHKVTLHLRRGLMSVLVDGNLAASTIVHREEALIHDFHGANMLRRTGFGHYGSAGRSMWRSVSYQVTNPTLPSVRWSWQANSGEWPDEYQRKRMIQIHANHPDQQPWPDHGYSSWVQMPDGHIVFVDYTNAGDMPGCSHLVGTLLDPADVF